jgi:hypothetical protein
MGVKIADGFMGSNPNAFHPPVSLEQAHKVFKQWLGGDYDTDALDAMLAAAAVERLDGDPVWLLIISGSGNAKTETVQALNGINALVVSTITSEGALLSATAKKERTKESTGGLLREIGERRARHQRLHLDSVDEPGPTRPSARCAPRNPRRLMGSQSRYRRREELPLGRANSCRRCGYDRMGPTPRRHRIHG